MNKDGLYLQEDKVSVSVCAVTVPLSFLYIKPPDSSLLHSEHRASLGTRRSIITSAQAAPSEAAAGSCRANWHHTELLCLPCLGDWSLAQPDPALSSLLLLVTPWSQGQRCIPDTSVRNSTEFPSLPPPAPPGTAQDRHH